MIKGKFYLFFEMYRLLIWFKKLKRLECNFCLLYILKNILVELKLGFIFIFFIYFVYKYVIINLILYYSK